MNVVFDTNVVLDILQARKPHVAPAVALFTKIECGEIIGHLCATTITTIDYLTTKAVNKTYATQNIKKLLALFEIAPVNRIVLNSALALKFTDYEDAVLHDSALHAGANAIITRDIKGFKNATLTIYSPNEFLAALTVI